MYDFEGALRLTGYGKFHYEIFGVCALSILSVGFQNGLTAYISPAVQCELELSSMELSFLNICFLVGGVSSCFLWGLMADIKGRKRILILTHLLNASITIISIPNQSIVSLFICRFINGFLIGAPGSIIFSYLAEFQPEKHKSSILCFSGVFFTFSWLFLPLLAWLVLPLDFHYKFQTLFAFTPWRLLIFLLVIPEIIVGLWLTRLPESPKFYLAKGETRKALIILKLMFSQNTGRHCKEYPVKNLCNDFKNNTQVSCRGTTLKICQEIFRKPLLRSTLLTTGIMFTNMFGFFGLGWWLPELFIRFELYHSLHPNETVTVKELALLEIATNACKPSFDVSVIQSTLIMGASSMCGSILSGWLASRISLKIISSVSMLLGGVSTSSIYFLSNSYHNIIVASIFQASMIAANMTIGGLVVSLFPTSVGAIALCLVMCAGRIGAIASNIVFGLFIDKHCEIPIFVVAVGIIIGAILCYAVPDLPQKNQNKEEQDFNTRI